MLTLNELRPGRGAHKRKHRRGKGTGSGSGCMAGRGNKGDGSRSGRKHKTYFEGGQTPLTRRVPKRGFENIFRKRYQIVNLRDLAAVASHEGEIDAKVLHAQGLIHSADLPVKVLGTGDAGRPLAVKADAFSKAAQEKLKPVKATTR